MGKLIKNTQCQLTISTRYPPNTGPKTGPINPGIVAVFNAAKKSLRLKDFINTKRDIGTIIEPPTPWITRDISKKINELDKAQSNEPSVNSETAITKIFLVPNLSDKKPLTGINNARVKA
ncbi:hypothetical protein GAPWKB30_0628 [Gilliamella apicola]|nr:hypothetical protein GAPWKB30_0628 [Gilliamella apicola]